MLLGNVHSSQMEHARLKSRDAACMLYHTMSPSAQAFWELPAAPDRLPICICTFKVSSGCMVPCEAALAIAPAITSCTGF